MERPFPGYQGDDPYIFVCYAHDDAEIVYPEITRLRDEGLNIWYDEGISPGSTWSDEVGLALTQCAVFLYFVTPRSVASINCRNEVNFCLSRERKVLSVHLEQTELPVGLELNLTAMQAILRADYTTSAYETKLTSSLRSLLPDTFGAATTPSVGTSVTQPDQKSIGILPLANRSSDPETDYLCESISEELIGALSKVGGLRVASQLSSFALRSESLAAGPIGEKLKVAHVLSGSIQKAGNRVRIHVLLSNAEDGNTLWSEHYSRDLDDIFELQEDVARQITDALRVELGTDQAAQLVDVGTRVVQAYNAFLLGVHECRKNTRQSLGQAVDQLQHAIRLDARFGRAHWWLYQSYQRLAALESPRDDMLRNSEEALNAAESTGFLPPFPWSVARRLLYPEKEPSERVWATRACENVRRPDPEGQRIEYIVLGDCLTAAGLYRGGVKYHRCYFEGEHRDLSDVFVRQHYINQLTLLGYFDKAIDLWTELIAAQPNDLSALSTRSMLYSRTGQYGQADADLARLSKVRPQNFPQFYHFFWRRELDVAKDLFALLVSEEILGHRSRCWGYFLLGDLDRGMEHLSNFVSGAGVAPFFFRITVGRVLPQSVFREVERHPGFQALLRRFGIDDAWRDELMAMANDLTDITGIHVQLDDDY